MTTALAPPAAMGAETPRLFTPPLRPLTPETSLGFRCIAFAEEVLGLRLDPWQRWLLIAALEINPDGTYRFRTVLLLVARQNGKTTVVKALILWAMATERARLVVGTAQDRDIAKRAWNDAVKLAEGAPLLAYLMRPPRRANGEESFTLTNGAEYIIKATTEDAGRGVAGVDLLVLDELRTHKDSKAWGALSKTTMARPNALTIAMSNAGSDDSVVLNALREAALAGNSPSLGLFEWSAPDGCDLDDLAAICQANPSLGHGRLSLEAVADARAIDPAAVYRTEVLCQRVQTLDSAVDAAAWRACADASATLSRQDTETTEAFEERRKGLRIVACLDVALDGAHATLALAAPTSDGRVRVEIAAAWHDTAAARAELPDLLARINPSVLAWFPAGPAAALATTLKDKRTLPSRRTKFEELTGAAVTAACMGLADLARAGRVLHPSDDLLDAQVTGAARLTVADGWRFTRRAKTGAHVDAVYAVAGAAHVALLLPVSRAERWANADMTVEPPG